MVDPCFTKLDFPVTKGMPLLNHHLGGFWSCEVAGIWPDKYIPVLWILGGIYSNLIYCQVRWFQWTMGTNYLDAPFWIIFQLANDRTTKHLQIKNKTVRLCESDIDFPTYIYIYINYIYIPSRELTYPPTKTLLSPWFSHSQGGICIRSQEDVLHSFLNLKFRGVTPPRNSLFYSTLYFLLYSTRLYYYLPYSTVLLYPTLLYCTLLYYSLSSLKLPTNSEVVHPNFRIDKLQSKKYVCRQISHKCIWELPPTLQKSQNESSMPLIGSRLGVWQNQHTAYHVHCKYA